MQHKWSGWPGAWCLNCGIEDQVEIAIGDGVYNPYTNEWSDKQREIDCMTAMRECHGEEDSFNPYVNRKEMIDPYVKQKEDKK